MKLKVFILIFWVWALAALFQSCAAPPPRKPSGVHEKFFFREERILPLEIEDSDWSSLLSALEGSLAYLEKMRLAALIRPRDLDETFFSPDQIQRSLIRFREILMATADRAEIERKIWPGFGVMSGFGSKFVRCFQFRKCQSKRNWRSLWPVFVLRKVHQNLVAIDPLSLYT